MKLSAFTIIVVFGVFAGSAAAEFATRGFVVANGGLSAVPATNGVYKLYGTLGEPGVGVSQNTSWTASSGFWSLGGSRVLAVDPPGGARVPTAFALGLVTPNPTRNQVRFHLALPKAAIVTLTVYDVSGRQVGDKVSQQLDAGEHELFWWAPSAQAGIYFMRLATDGILKAERTVVLVP